MKKLNTVKPRISALSFAVILAATTSGRAAVLHVPTDYPTIQGAVDAARSGDQVRIAAGTYNEQVLIAHKNLKLIGEPGAVLEAKTGLAATLTAYGDPNVQPLLAIALCDDVTVRGLTLDGKRLGPVNPGLVGVAFHGSSGRMEHCFVRGFRSATGVGGVGFGSGNWPYLGRPPQQVQVSDNHFEDNGASIGLAADGAVQNEIRLRFRIEGNTISGFGPTDSEAQVGVFARDGTTGEISENTITGHNYTGVDLNFSIGIEIASTGLPVRFKNNVFRNNQIGLFSQSGHGSQFVNNMFEGPGYGLVTTDSGDQIINNQFIYSSIGIALYGDDPVFGTALGIASDAAVIANQFCQVAIPILIEPLVTGVQQRANRLNACHPENRCNNH